jgi:uncharacterized cupredoxin-like copper-binding protein
MPVQLSESFLTAFAVAAFATAVHTGAGTALAAGSHAGGHGDTSALGRPGTAAEADRTIEIVMGDNYFEPEKLTVRAGETVRFVIRNEGEFLHEFNLGTAAMHAAHQAEMMTMMEHGMLTPTGIDHDKMKMDHGAGGKAHDDPNSVLIEPGKTAELVWTFTATAALEFACNVPGHYDAGMMGEIGFSKPGGADS